MLGLFDVVFDQILLDKNFSSENTIKIFSTFNIEFYGNVKSFLNLEGPEKILVAKIICKSGKISVSEGAGEKGYDLEYQRKIIGFLNSVVNIDASETRFPLLGIYRDYQIFLGKREEKCFLLNKRVLEDDFYNLLEKEYQVIKKKKIEDLERAETDVGLALATQNETKNVPDSNGAGL